MRVSFRRARMAAPLLLALLSGAAPLQAGQTGFVVMLGERQIGTLSYAPGSLRTTTDNAPLGIGNGRFTATLKQVQDANGTARLGYSGHSQSSSENRLIEILFDDATPLAVKVTPDSERTDMSDPARLKGQALDPIRAFGALLTVKGCPSGVTLYDGRRMARVKTAPAQTPNGMLRCEGEYRVLAGASHARPLGIRRARLVMEYQPGSAGFTLMHMDIKAGPLALRLMR